MILDDRPGTGELTRVVNNRDKDHEHLLPDEMAELMEMFKGDESTVIDDLKYLIDLKDQIKKSDATTTELKTEYQQKESELITRMENDDIQSVNVGGKLVFKRTSTYASIPKDQQEPAFDWLRVEGYENLIKPTVNSRSLTSAIVDFIDQQGEDNLPDCIKVARVSRLGFRANGNGK